MSKADPSYTRVGARPMVLGAFLLLACTASVQAQAIISNGVVQLGVNRLGHLNVPVGTPGSGNETVVGLRFVPNDAEAVAPGCQCEGWGAGDSGSGVSGYASARLPGSGGVNLREVSFASTASTATSVVEVVNPANGQAILQVTHSYLPEPVSPHLYRVDVTIQNLTLSNVRLRYRRVMDWDIEPTPFDEYVTIVRGTSPFLVLTTNNGFDVANPLSPPAPLGDRPVIGTFVDWPLGAPPDTDDSGLNPQIEPLDQGAMFTFDFGTLAAGASRSFVTFYGAAASEAEIEEARGAVGMEAYSLGQAVLRDLSDPESPHRPLDADQNGIPDSAETGMPNTFLFGFGAIGGTQLSTPTATTTSTPVPTSTPTHTPTMPPTQTTLPTETPTETHTPVPTETSTETPTPTATSTLTATSTHTPAATSTHTPPATSTHTPAATSTQTPTATSTQTPTRTRTTSPTQTRTHTATEAPTRTPTRSATRTPTPSAPGCTRSASDWKNHPDTWPASTLTLGAQAYSRTELLVLLKASSLSDASLLLAQQLIAAKLNASAGADPSSIAPVLAASDAWLAGYPGKLPYRVRLFSAQGLTALSLAIPLALYNNGLLPGGPPRCDGGDRVSRVVTASVPKVDSDPGGRACLALLLLIIGAALTRRSGLGPRIAANQPTPGRERRPGRL